MTPPAPKPPPPAYRVLEIGAAPGTTMLEATLNTYAAQGYKFVGIIEAPSLGVCVVMQYTGT